MSVTGRWKDLRFATIADASGKEPLGLKVLSSDCWRCELRLGRGRRSQDKTQGHITRLSGFPMP